VGFSPLPAQRADLPIWIGATADAALARAGRVAQGYQSSRTGPGVMRHRAAVIAAAAAAAGRPMPVLSSRVIVEFGPAQRPAYTLAGSPAEMLAEVHAFRDAGVTHLALDFWQTDATEIVRNMERFDREVIAAL
jgi:alkanesulfonate monooxygenase SsuD/methylene tetrahydromethanopterin reductase-like flavin-dependent oxidoreductase (luciferase family)